MPVILCSHCGTRNLTAGRCDMCDRSLGSIRRAVHAAIISSFALVVFWVGLGLLTGLELTFLSVVFGALVSLATVKYSHGSGLLYQLVATTATVAGILLADVTLTLSLQQSGGIGAVLSMNMWQWGTVLEHGLLWDPFTFLFMVLGVLGGFYIWR